MTAEYPTAQWVPIPGFGFPTGAHNGNKPRWIVIHGTASGDGTAAQQARFFQSTDQHGVHFVVGKDGTVIQMVQLADAAYGNGGLEAGHDSFWPTTINLNTCTISIEHCKSDIHNSDILTPAQQAASFALVKWLCQRLNIPTHWADASGGITGHYSIDPISRNLCPGPYPWDELFVFLKGEPMDSNFTQTSPNTLHSAKTGFAYHGYIYDNVVAKINPAAISQIIGLPLEVEHPDSDGYWRQRTTVGMIVQSGSNHDDFHVEALPAPAAPPPPLTVDPLLSETKAWVALMPPGLKG